MKNFIQPGNSISAIAPVGGVVSGIPVIIGSLAGIPGTTALEAAEFELHLVGVYDIDKATGAAWAVGDKIYWDATAKKGTKTTTSNTLFAVAVAAAASGDTTGRIRLGAPAV
ncbi:DUF2190 family protein [Mesorhizobium sp. M0983]|uniref:DUF2190 family protein n=1 Tax=Mesorhizobium sp. M0983 TaxID=2957040 RepID=UPI003335C086